MNCITQDKPCPEHVSALNICKGPLLVRCALRGCYVLPCPAICCSAAPVSSPAAPCSLRASQDIQDRMLGVLRLRVLKINGLRFIPGPLNISSKAVFSPLEGRPSGIMLSLSTTQFESAGELRVHKKVKEGCLSQSSTCRDMPPRDAARWLTAFRDVTCQLGVCCREYTPCGGGE